MKLIQIKLSYSTGLYDFFDNKVTTVEIDEKYLGSGGFGKVYVVKTIDKSPTPLPLVAKILFSGKEKNFETVVRLQRSVRAEIQNLQKKGKLFFESYPALIALPLLSFEGILDGKPIKGYLSYNLNELGFESLQKMLDSLEADREKWTRFQSRDLSVRYKMVYHLAASCAFLRKIHFIHADITPDNVFVHQTEPLCALIDFDSGALIETGSDYPTTSGKEDCMDWTPPELIYETGQKKSNDSSGENEEKRLTAYVDDWAFTVALHYILTGFQAFFTKNMWPETIKLFDEMYQDGSYVWPDIRPEAKYVKLFADNYQEVLPQYRQYYDKLDESVKRGFEFTFSRGAYRLTYRHDAKWWTNVLEKCVANSPFQVNVKWRTFKNLVQEFPDIQSTKDTPLPKAWADKIHFSKDYIGLETTSASQNQSSYTSKTSSEQSTSPKKDSKHISGNPKSSKNSKQLLDSYIKDLLPDLIIGDQNLDMHKGYLTKALEENDLDATKYIQKLESFIDHFKSSTQNNVISNLDYHGLLLEAKSLEVDKEIIDKLLKPYPRI